MDGILWFWKRKNLLLSSLYNSLSLSLSMQHASLSTDTHPRRVPNASLSQKYNSRETGGVSS